MHHERPLFYSAKKNGKEINRNKKYTQTSKDKKTKFGCKANRARICWPNEKCWKETIFHQPCRFHFALSFLCIFSSFPCCCLAELINSFALFNRKGQHAQQKIQKKERKKMLNKAEHSPSHRPTTSERILDSLSALGRLSKRPKESDLLPRKHTPVVLRCMCCSCATTTYQSHIHMCVFQFLCRLAGFWCSAGSYGVSPLCIA